MKTCHSVQSAQCALTKLIIIIIQSVHDYRRIPISIFRNFKIFIKIIKFYDYFCKLWYFALTPSHCHFAIKIFCLRACVYGMLWCFLYTIPWMRFKWALTKWTVVGTIESLVFEIYSQINNSVSGQCNVESQDTVDEKKLLKKSDWI